MDRPIKVMFLCTYNSARSQIAEAILNRYGRGRFRAFSAGSRPDNQVHPHATHLLSILGYDVSALRPKSWHEFETAGAPDMDFVFTIGDIVTSEAAPIWPRQPMTAQWSVPDPSLVQGTEAEKRIAFAETHRMLKFRIDLLLSLPVRTLEKMTLQRKLDEIGQAIPAPESE